MTFKDHRLSVNLTQEEVAAVLGISRDDYRMYETGTKTMPPDTCAAFDELIAATAPISTYTDNLRERREAVKLTRRQVAAILDVSEASVKDYESGRRVPDRIIAQRYDALLRGLSIPDGRVTTGEYRGWRK